MITKITKKELRKIEEQKYKNEQENFRQNLPKKMFYLMAEAKKQDVKFEIKTKQEEIQVEFIFYFENGYHTITIDMNTCEEWNLEDLNQNFLMLEQEKLEKQRKEAIRKNAIAKLTEEEIKILRIIV